MKQLTLVCEKNLKSWTEFRDYCSRIQEEEKQEKKYIFRGQSNYSNELERGPFLKNEGFKRWELRSSFDRTYPKSSHNFGNFVTDIVRNFNVYFKGYDQIFNEPRISEDLAKASLTEKLKFFQHYGIPTCLIDFTLDPLTALFFAVSDIKYESGGQSDEFPNCYFSIFQLNRKLLNEIVGIKKLDNSDEENSFQKFCHYRRNFERYIEGKDEHHDFHYWSWIDIPETFPFKWNVNLERQKGCFLLFESEPYKGDNLKKSFEWMLKCFEEVSQPKTKEPILTIYNIPYKSIFKENLRDGGRLYNGSLYEFMGKKKKLGKCLFNDMQGLKYDIQFRLSVM